VRALILYLAVGLGVSLAGWRGFRLDAFGFWRDLLLWPVMLVSEALHVDIGLPTRLQEWVVLGFGVLLTAYAITTMKLSSTRAGRGASLGKERRRRALNR
jgi:hypothetical protein